MITTAIIIRRRPRMTVIVNSILSDPLLGLVDGSVYKTVVLFKVRGTQRQFFGKYLFGRRFEI